MKGDGKGDWVQEFCQSNGLDEEATKRFSELPPDQQHEVLVQGDLTDARNPSAVLCTRIRQMQAKATGIPLLPPDVVRTNKGDKGGGKGFKGYPTFFDMSQEGGKPDFFMKGKGKFHFNKGGYQHHHQHHPYDEMTQGAFPKSYIPNGKGEVRPDFGYFANYKGDFKGNFKGDFKGEFKGKGDKGDHHNKGSYHSGNQKQDHWIEDFIRDHSLDEKAGREFRECSPRTRCLVLEAGGLNDARNPSAVVCTRIRDIKSGNQIGKGSKDHNQFKGVIKGGGEEGKGFQHHEAVPKTTTVRPVLSGSFDERVTQFVENNNLDERAENALRTGAEKDINELMSRDIGDARNPSAVILTRLRQIVENRTNGHSGHKHYSEVRDDYIDGVSERKRRGTSSKSPRTSAGRSRVKEELEDEHIDDSFIVQYDLDDKAKETWKELSNRQRRDIIKQGPLNDARNPSAVLCTRVRTLVGTEKESKLERIDRATVDLKIKKFVKDYHLDERAQQILQDEQDTDVLNDLLERPLDDARNPSAVILSRLRATLEEKYNKKASSTSAGEGSSYHDKSKGSSWKGSSSKGYGKGKDDWWSWGNPWSNPWEMMAAMKGMLGAAWGPWGKGYSGGKGGWSGDWNEGKGRDRSEKYRGYAVRDRSRSRSRSRSRPRGRR